ncbi:peptidoglycan-binding domain-containing protein [Streptomyces synnematoformans]|uniref:Peptidoglycan-binding domain-containing protein n=1 Tax=Streptomyces synnematoformans TaxID=415721 RepID=A0ABN2YBP4_9ACTN
MIPRACRTCGEPLQEGGGQGCACGAAAGAGGAQEQERRLVRPYVMQVPGAGQEPGEPYGATGDGPPVGYGGATAVRPEGQGQAENQEWPRDPGRHEGRGWPGDAGRSAGQGWPEGQGPPVLPAGPGDTQPLGPAPDGPADADLGLFADGHTGPRGPLDPYDAEDPRDPYAPDSPHRPRHPRERRAARGRRRLTLVLTVGGVVAALSVGLLGSGLFSDDGGDDRAVPKPDAITALPTGGGTKPAREDTPSGAPSASAPTGDPAEPSPTTSDQPSTAAGDPGRAPTRRSEAGQVTGNPPTADPTASNDPTSGTTPGGRDNADPPPTLREGDSGPEVVELQKRLDEAGYRGLPDPEGDYGFFTSQKVGRFQQDNDIEDDERGVYGPATRRALESMTKEP